jgi:two-component system, LytTR family, response regulator
MTIRCAIVDDEKLAREGLRILLQRCEAFDLDVVGEAASVDDALALVQRNRPDLVFLDVNMPGRSGFELVRAVEPDRRPLIVFVTAYPEHAVRGFEASAVDYLLKPVSDRRLVESLRRARTRILEQDAAARTRAMSRLLATPGEATVDEVRAILERDPAARPARILINDSGRRTSVDLDAIVCIQAAGDYMCVTTREGDLVSRTTLNELMHVLGAERCVRIHRSAAVNPRRVREIVSLGRSRYRLALDNGTTIESSRRYSAAVRRIAARLAD